MLMDYMSLQTTNFNNEDDEIDQLALPDAPTGAHSWLRVRSWLAVRAGQDEAQVEAWLRIFTSPSRISQSSSDGGSTDP